MNTSTNPIFQGTAYNNHYLVFEGLNYKANIWLNGELIAPADSVEGCFRMFEFDVTGKIRTGEKREVTG